MRAVLGSALPGGGTAAESRDGSLERALRAVQRRMRVQRALDAAASGALAGVGIAALAVAAWKTERAPEALAGFLLAAVAPLAFGVVAMLRAAPRLLVARVLDRSLASADLCASAAAFLDQASATRTRFMRACIATAEREALRAEPAAAVPWRRPRALVPALWLALGLAGFSALGVRRPPPARREPPPKLHLLEAEDIAAAQAVLAPIVRAETKDEGLNQTARELNALVEALRDERVDRASALRELRELAERLKGLGEGDDQNTLREALNALGQSLEHDALAAALADALRAADVARSRAELDRLAAAMRDAARNGDADRALARALARAAEARGSRPDPELARTRADVERLLKKKPHEADGDDPEQQSLLHKKQRELDRLEREEHERQQQERELDQLKRELGAAGKSLGSGQRRDASQHLADGSKALEGAEQRQALAEQRKRLREQLEQLRELVSKGKTENANGGEPKPSNGDGVRRLQLSEFGRAARGERGEKDAQEKSEDSQARGAVLRPGSEGGEPKATLVMPGANDGQSEPTGETSAESSSSPGESGRPQHDSQTKPLASERRDTSVSGQATAGATRSQVILEAGQHGFASRAYERVHSDYERHAEAVIERDHVPGGYRFYVRRYFQLIRPREATP